MKSTNGKLHVFLALVVVMVVVMVFFKALVRTENIIISNISIFVCIDICWNIIYFIIIRYTKFIFVSYFVTTYYISYVFNNFKIFYFHLFVFLYLRRISWLGYKLLRFPIRKHNTSREKSYLLIIRRIILRMLKNIFLKIVKRWR